MLKDYPSSNAGKHLAHNIVSMVMEPSLEYVPYGPQIPLIWCCFLLIAPLCCASSQHPSYMGAQNFSNYYREWIHWENCIIDCHVWVACAARLRPISASLPPLQMSSFVCSLLSVWPSFWVRPLCMSWAERGSESKVQALLFWFPLGLFYSFFFAAA